MGEIEEQRIQKMIPTDACVRADSWLTWHFNIKITCDKVNEVKTLRNNTLHSAVAGSMLCVLRVTLYCIQ